MHQSLNIHFLIVTRDKQNNNNHDSNSDEDNAGGCENTKNTALFVDALLDENDGDGSDDSKKVKDEDMNYGMLSHSSIMFQTIVSSCITTCLNYIVTTLTVNNRCTRSHTKTKNIFYNT